MSLAVIAVIDAVFCMCDLSADQLSDVDLAVTLEFLSPDLLQLFAVVYFARNLFTFLL